MAKRYYWLKLKADWFSDKRIKKLRSIAGGDTHTIIYAELNALKTELPGRWEYYIDRLSVHIASSGKQYHNHAATIYKWAQEDAEKAAITGNALKKGIPDYSYSEEDSL